MRKVLCTLAGAGLAFGLSASAFAGPVNTGQLQLLDMASNGQKTPKAYARIERTADGKFKMGKWHQVTSTGLRGNDCSDGLSFDAFTPNTAAGTWAPFNHDVLCGAPFAATTSWWFGANVSNPHYANDLTLEAGSGDCAKELALAWNWNPVPPYADPNGEPMLVAIFTSPTAYANDCVAPVAGGTGWIFDFGPSLPGVGYFFSHINLGCTDPNVFWEMSPQGGMEVIWAQDISPDPNDPNFTLVTTASRSQPMLWATEHDNATGSLAADWNQAGTSANVQWDDDSVLDPNDPNLVIPDLIFDPNLECYNYSVALPEPQCPEPNLMQMIVFGNSDGCGGGGPGPCGAACPNPGCNSGGVDADFDNNCIVNLSDLAVLLANFGGAATCAQGDTNNNGFAQLDDLSNLLARFGTNCN